MKAKHPRNFKIIFIDTIVYFIKDVKKIRKVVFYQSNATLQALMYYLNTKKP